MLHRLITVLRGRIHRLLAVGPVACGRVTTRSGSMTMGGPGPRATRLLAALRRMTAEPCAKILIGTFLLMPAAASAATAPGTVIENTATSQYFAGGTPILNTSNTTSETVQVAPTGSTIGLSDDFPTGGTHAFTTPIAQTGGGPVPLAPPTDVTGAPITIADVPALYRGPYLHVGNAVFMVVQDADEDDDPSVVDSVLVTITSSTGDSVVIEFFETGPSTGVFAGWVQTTSAASPTTDEILNAEVSGDLTMDYVDDDDPLDVQSATAPFDPVSRLFDSTDGSLIDGATVTLVDAVTGLPATVFADDGVSPFPSSIITGEDVLTAGPTYNFGPGGYRFPVVPFGDYRIEVTPPTGYLVPSTVPEAVLQTLPGAPYTIAADGSYGADFEHAFFTQLLLVDVPLDRGARTPAEITFLAYDPLGSNGTLPVSPTSCAVGGDTNNFQPLGDPTVPRYGTIDTSAPVSLAVADVYHGGDAIFIQVEDLDQNLDPAVRETVEVEVSTDDPADVEILTLTETGPNTGVFAGYIQSAGPPPVQGDCVLTVSDGTQITASYTDQSDGTDTAVGAVLVDPFGVVFDSSDGSLVDGAVVSIIDVNTGLPADVFGDDGVSAYPNVVISGDGAVDASGAVYDFPPGFYRFPFLAPGLYRLEVVPPAGYNFPSVVATADLQVLPGAPYQIVVGSRGEDFVLPVGPALHIDLPVDPVAAELFVRKTAFATSAAVGDFVQYEITVENSATLVAPNTVATDVLPVGFRYVTGSTRIDGVAAADPTVADDGRTIAFDLGDLAPGDEVSVRYVVEVGAGAPEGTAINRVIASADGAADSAEATAPIVVREDLFRSRSILVGHVALNSCDDEVANDLVGVAGIRIYLEDGRYVVTDEAGLYHFEGVSPGTHVVQLDLDTIPSHLEVMPCEDNARFAGRSFSQFVELTPGGLWRADFYLAEKPAPTGALDLSVHGDLEDGAIAGTAELSGGPLAMRSRSLTLIVPDDLAAEDYLLDGQPVVPEVRGPVRTFRLEDTEGDWAQALSFSLELAPGASGSQGLRATAAFRDEDGVSHRTQVVELPFLLAGDGSEEREYLLSPRFDTRGFDISGVDRDAIHRLAEDWDGFSGVQLEVVGHTDSVPVRTQGLPFTDNQSLSLLRALSVARILSEELGVPPASVTVRGEGARLPVASNDTAEGRAQNRRVEINIIADRSRADAAVASASADARVEFGTEVEAAAEARGVEPAAIDQAPVFDQSLLADLEPGRGFVWPLPDTNPSQPAVWVMIQHEPGVRVNLFANGEPVSGLLFDGRIEDAARGIAVSAWRAVHMDDGGNELVAELVEPDGDVERLSRTVHIGVGPTHLRFLPERSRLVADGRSSPVLAVQLFDRWDQPVRPGLIGDFNVEPPYRSMLEVERLRDISPTQQELGRFTYTTDGDGVAYIELEPTTLAGQVVVNLRLGERNIREVRARLTPGDRDWILVGLAEGTLGYNTVSGDLQALGESGLEEEYYEEGRVAFFAKGQISGETLLTVAYDSARASGQDPSRLFGTISPDEYYTIYGDGTEQRFDAASAEKLYVRIDRGTFYALFGDYDTGLTYTELGRYSRRFTGLRSEYAGESFSYSAFASESEQAFVRDEIQGDGTSGLYQLSRRPIIINSDRIVLETRDRFQGQEVLETVVLQRFLDYNIDYLAGTVFFKRPIPARDDQFNPIFIVAEYEVDGNGSGDVVAGGRAAFHLADDRVEIGATLIDDSSDQVDGELQALDLTVRLNGTTEFRAEVATSQADNNGTPSEGDGYRAELIHSGERITGRVYMSDVDLGFGLGQQNASGVGQRGLGVEGRYFVTDRLAIEGQAYTQEQDGSLAEREVVEVGARYDGGSYTVNGGIRHAGETDSLGADRDSQQAYAGANVALADGNLNLRAQTEQSLSGQAESVDFPDRTLVGVDYRLTANTDLFVEQEWASSGTYDADTTRAGLRTRPWEGGEISSTLNNQYGESGTRLFSNFGLAQRWQYSEAWSFDAALDRVDTLKRPGFELFDPDHPPSSGTLSDDYTAVSLGANYAADRWIVNNRVEYRDGDRSDKWGVLSSFYREPEPGRGFSASLSLYDTSEVGVGDRFDGALTLGLAYRPLDSRWTILERLDLIYESADLVGSSLRSWRLVSNLNANYMLNRRTQMTFQYGAKYVRSNFDDFSVSGYTDLWGFGMRHDINNRWDVGFDLGVLNSWRSNTHDYRLGASVGYNLAENLWISLGYNVAGFEDEDFSRAGYTARGPFIQFAFKFDQQSVRDLFSHEEPAPITSVDD